MGRWKSETFWLMSRSGRELAAAGDPVARLIGTGLIEKVCRIVPRDSLRLQSVEAFADAM